jgi:RNA polymerase sigma factor (sigma-70 family)
MASGQLGPVVDYLRKVVSPRGIDEPTDGQLLEWFVEQHHEDAFGMLVQRHGAMVRGVCLRVLNDCHDADDAFQATFLVLARKASAIRKRDSVASWLYGVAYRTALRARARNARRQAHEREAPDMAQADPLAELAWRELRPVLDAELDRLPEKYRAPLLLCYFEGKTNEQAARQLGLTKGTVSGRLARARDLLRGRLARRGLALSGGVLAMALADGTAMAAVPPALVASTIKAATLVAAGKAMAAGISVPVAALVEGVLEAMVMTKFKSAAVVLLAVTLLGAGAGVLTYGNQPEEGVAAGLPAPTQTVAQKADEAAADRDRLQGTWILLTHARGGQPAREENVNRKMVFAGNKVTIYSPRKDKVYTFRLHPAEAPKQIDFSRPEQDTTVMGIYRLKGDTLTLCLGEKRRPTAFATEEGTPDELLTLQREVVAAPGGNDADLAAALKKENETLRRELQVTRAELERALAQLTRMRALAEEQLRQALQAEDEARRQADQAKARAPAQQQSANSLKMIALAMHNYHDAYGHLPPAAISSKNGKPLLSWRVAILPFIEQDALYRAFKLDQPWDSPHNKELLAQMPKIYAPVRGKAADGHSTFYQVFTGKGTIFDGKKGLRLSDITDGTSNTILAVEAGEAVPWTKPEDLLYRADKELPKLGGMFDTGFHILWADGSVRFVRNPVNEQVLRLAITRNDGQVLDHDKLGR